MVHPASPSPVTPSPDKPRLAVPRRDQAYWEAYLSERTGDYSFRCIRYGAVLDVLTNQGFSATDSLCDVGAGRQEFAKFLREQGWSGEYTPVDGSLDGTDLDTWVPERMFDWMVAIEVIEHLFAPERMLNVLRASSHRGFVITTPNPETVDVLAIDRTHVSVIHPHFLTEAGLAWKRATLFASPEHRKENDSLVAWSQ